MQNEITKTVEIKDAPEGVQVKVKNAPKSKGKISDVKKTALLEKTAKKAGNDLTVTIATKPKKATAKKDAPKVESKPVVKKVEPKAKAAAEKIDVSKIAPLVVPKELLESKLAALDKKLLKEKLTMTKTGFHVAYGYFLCKARSGKLLTIEYHETLKPAKWVVRDDKGKVITPEPIQTLWQAHQAAIKL